MSYIQGFLLAVPTANKAAYRKMAQDFWEMLRGYGCIALYENWGVDVPDGKVTSFPLAVKKKDDETVVFSWMVWPDRATCDSAAKRMMEDPAMQNLGEMPFDGMRMMWGGFEQLVELGDSAWAGKAA